MTIEPGESGPRRKTQEPHPLSTQSQQHQQQPGDAMDVAGANAEAARMAAQLGLSSSTMTASQNNKRVSSNKSLLFGRNRLSRKGSNDTRTSSLLNSQHDQRQLVAAVNNAAMPRDHSFSHTSDLTNTVEGNMAGEDESAQSVKVPMFDCHGQKAPYYDGPYYIRYTHDGRPIKKRWCE